MCERLEGIFWNFTAAGVDPAQVDSTAHLVDERWTPPTLSQKRTGASAIQSAVHFEMLQLISCWHVHFFVVILFQ